MRWPPSKMGCTDRQRLVWIFFGLMTVFSVPMCHGTTNSRDVDAINSLYTALGLPLLPGWSALGGDPCGDGWQGVQCVNTNITGIVLNDANLVGELSDDLGDFSAMIQMDLSNNKIGGSIPSSLPITLRSFFLSGNQFNGSIPDTLSTLGQLTDLSFGDNHLTGEIPDAFQTLTGLITLDLSGNNLSGQLPPSMGSLSSLTTLDLQNNQLSGRLDVLEDLPLTDLDIENNQFWGPIPKKLMNIQNFRRTGNPFNTSVIPPPPASPPLPPPSSSPSPSGASGALSPPGANSPQLTPGTQALGPSAPGTSNSSTGLKSLTTNKVWIAVGGLIVSALLALALCFCVPKCCKRCQPASGISKSREMDAYEYTKAQPKPEESFSKLYSPMEKGHGDPGLRPPIGLGNDLRIKPEAEKKIIKTMTSISDMTDSDADILDMPPPPPPPPPPFLSVDKVAVNPIFAPVTMTGQSSRSPNSVRSFTIASLQQFTNSFSQANLIGGGMLGTVYRAELPIGKPLAVKKLDAAVCRKQSNEDFLELVSDVSKLQHPNVVELVGYCAEHGQQLLVYEYCGNGTLHEALHLDDEIHKKLSWNTRIRLALGAATALEYLHEVCQPAIVHKNFKSANILLDDKLVVHVSDCGLAPLLSSVHISQMSGHGYGAPEVEFGSYTSMSDVYSFGVVMLELLTGRKSYDRWRPHGEQHLVRWAVPQLHDIDSLSRMVDPSLNGAYPSKALSRFADIISLCLQPEPEFRPPISEIVQNLLNMV